MLRVGVVGAGWFASRRHLPELVEHPEVELVALCRRSPEPLARLAKWFGVARTYTEPETMLAEAELDAVLVCSPHNLHHDHTVACLDAGCHVLLEKPMAITGAEARDLVARAEAAGKILDVAYNPPYWRHSAWLKERVEAGDFGEIEGVDLRSSNNQAGLYGREPLPAKMPGVVPPTVFRGDPLANGGGHLIDGGSHMVCEVLWVTGQAVTSVSCAMDQVPADQRYALSFTLAGGGSGQLAGIADSTRPGKQLLGLWQGTKATALVRSNPDFEIHWLPGYGAPSWVREADMPDVPQPVVSFVDAVLGRTAPRSPGSDCVAYVDVIEAAYRAAQSGRTERPGAPPPPGPAPARRSLLGNSLSRSRPGEPS
jgi:predicted dehydrogenase